MSSTSKNVLSVSVPCLASSTTVVSDVFQFEDDMRGTRVDLVVNPATLTNAMTARLQFSSDNATWTDIDAANASVSITTSASATQFSFALNPNASTMATKFPLKQYGRVVVVSAVADTCTVIGCRVSNAQVQRGQERTNTNG